MYKPPEPAQYMPGALAPEGPHHVVQGAKNPKLNGPITFRYPTAFEEVLIGSRAQEIASGGRATPVRLEALPLRARLYAEAIATLEYVIKNAPEGWYTRGTDGKPLLAPGLIGDGDEEKVLEVYDAFLRWREAFRGRPAGAAEPDPAQAVVRGGGPGGGDGPVADDEPGGASP